MSTSIARSVEFMTASPNLSSPQAVAGSSSAPAAVDSRLERVCQDFEALLLSYMLRSMRCASEALGSSNEVAGGGLVRELMDEHLAMAVARRGGMGMARLLNTGFDHEGPVTDPGISPRMPALPLRAIPRVKTSETPSAVPAVLHPYKGMIERAAREHDLSPALLSAVILQESGGRADAVSPKGAKGLMQLMDGTARDLGVENPFNPEENILGGAKFLRRMLDRWEGDLELALASYNAGPSAVVAHGGVPPYPETRAYVQNVVSALEHPRVGYGPTVSRR